MNILSRKCITGSFFVLLSYTLALAGITPEEVKEFQELKIKADKGDPESQCQVGHSYRTGSGVKKDPVEGVKWLRKSAKQGNTLAQCNLGICYQYADGVEQDYAEAFKLYQMAAEQGANCGLTNLAFCYKQGEGVAKNPVEAYAHYIAAGAESWATEVGKSMSPDQITAGKRRSKEIEARIAAKKAGK
jgi:TPR repeat protein